MPPKPIEDGEPEEIIDDGDARKYFKEGQRFVTPINGDSTRGFYESLLQEKPDSHLAIRYCVENGLTSGEKHQQLLERYNDLRASGVFNVNRQALQRLGIKKEEKSTPVKRSAIKRELSESPEQSKAKKHKKEKKDKKEKKKEKKEKKKDKKHKKRDYIDDSD